MPGHHTTTTTTTTTTNAGATVASTLATATLKAATRVAKAAVTTHPTTTTASSTTVVSRATTTAAATVATTVATTTEAATAAAAAAEASKSVFVLAFDYVFYAWTFLLIGIVTYLSIYKYYQHLQMQQRMRRAASVRAQQQQQQQLQPRSNLMKLLDFIRYLFVLIYQRIIYPLFINRGAAPLTAQQQQQLGAQTLTSPFKPNTSLINNQSPYNTAAPAASATSSFSRFFSSAFSSSASSNQEAMFSVNNVLKWFYLNNVDANNRITSTVLNILNFNFSGSGQRPMSIGSKYDDLVFKHVDSALPRILDIRTVSSDNESLTLKSSVEFANVDFKVDIRKMQRVLDVRLLNATANVLMVLSQNKTNNLLFNIDCYFDPNSDVSLSFRRDANIDSGLYQYLESLIRVSVKHYMLSMEVNFISRKLTSNFRSMHPTAHQTLSSIINQSSVSTSSMIGVPSSSNTGNTTTQQQHQQHQQQQQQQHSPHYNPRVAASGQQNNTDQMRGLSDQQQQMRNNINEKRLLVKVLKANNLTNIEEPFCVVEMDYPMQKHITDVHRDISNINEQFLFDISASSEELTFSLFDRAKDYGNDLIGEAVLPVNDLCSSMSSKRVIQLHRYGQTKTGSITAEFLFIEPTTNRYDMGNKVNINRSSTNSRNSRSPYDPQFAQPGSNQYRDELGYDQKLNVITSDSLSSNSYLTPTMQNNYQQSPRGNQARGQDGYSPNSTLTDSYYNNNSNVQQQQQQQQQSSNIHIIPTSDAATRAALQQQQQQQQQQAQLPNSSVNMQQPGGANSRVINRNYLQIQPNTSGANNYATINKSGALMGQQQQQQQATASMYAVNSQLDPKHKQTISSSLKSLLMPRSTSRQHQQAAKKRDKSYDSPSLLMQSSGAAHYPYDTQSVNVDNNLRSSRTKGLTLRKLFGSKKAAQARQRYDTLSSGNIMQPLRPGSPAISVAISRPISPTQQLMMQNEQQQLYKQQQQQQQQKQQYLQQQQHQQQQFQQGYQNYPHQQLNIAPNFSNQPQQQQQHDYVMAMSSSTVNTTNKMMANEVDSYRKQEPLLLKRGYVAP